ncbi:MULTISPECIES: hypothetical protein [unclassified Methylophilus]|jgi:hypothetical protein|uniref:hypothetical protein n=1 Tax=unclassified Methylophilus TaxID=2630143 RepID=UPI00035F0BE3|nr:MULTISPECIES: hypothetical protein [unclassified Methylophilus]HCU85776.1 hypothetical protein [Methylophilus sp.]
MKKPNPVPGATSAMSLIAITAGAVSAALVIMFIGMFMTVVSIGSNPPSDMHAEGPMVASHVLVVDAVSNRAGQRAHKAEKGHFMDALLREDMHNPSAMAAEGHGQPAAKVTRIFANPMSMPFVSAKSRVTRV